MIRAHGLVEISRRDLCVAGCTALALAACTDGGAGVIDTGALGGGHGGPPVDAPGSGSGSDAGMTGQDAGVAATCGSGAVDVGAPGSIAINTPKYVSSARCFIVRDSGGLYAVSSICTHEGATNAVFGSNFRCPRHGAMFTFNGSIISGPVSTGLKHYAMCTMTGGNVGVTPTMVVSQSTRLVA